MLLYGGQGAHSWSSCRADIPTGDVRPANFLGIVAQCFGMIAFQDEVKSGEHPEMGDSLQPVEFR